MLPIHQKKAIHQAFTFMTDETCWIKLPYLWMKLIELTK